MISIKNLLDMIATEAIEEDIESRINNYFYEREKEICSPIYCPLKFIKRENGSYEWVED